MVFDEVLFPAQGRIATTTPTKVDSLKSGIVLDPSHFISIHASSQIPENIDDIQPQLSIIDHVVVIPVNLIVLTIARVVCSKVCVQVRGRIHRESWLQKLIFYLN